MPERMSQERLTLLRYLGAQVTLTPGSLMREAVEQGRGAAARDPGRRRARPVPQPANPEAHRRDDRPRDLGGLGGEVDVFVAGVGTGGTITGVGEVLKARKPGMPRGGRRAGRRRRAVGPRAPPNHMIQGIGAGFVPPLLNRAIIDEVVAVSDDEAFAHARRLAREEGISAGISSGATLAAALRVAAPPRKRGARRSSSWSATAASATSTARW